MTAYELAWTAVATMFLYGLAAPVCWLLEAAARWVSLDPDLGGWDE